MLVDPKVLATLAMAYVTSTFPDLPNDAQALVASRLVPALEAVKTPIGLYEEARALVQSWRRG